MSDLIVISVRHTIRTHRHITLWRPDNKGYTPVLPRAGRYSRECVTGYLDYYNDGGNIAVPASVVEALGVEPPSGFYDYSGPCIPNTRANWKIITGAIIWPTKYAVEPDFPGARRRKEAA